MAGPTLRQVADKHGNLQCNPAALDELEAVLTTPSVPVRAAGEVELRVDVPELVFAGRPLPVGVGTADGSRHAVRVSVTGEGGRMTETPSAPTYSFGTRPREHRGAMKVINVYSLTNHSRSR